jgi:hypothetical protein
MKYTISYVLHTLTGHGYKSALASNTRHVYRKGEYMIALLHDPYDKPADEIYPPSIEIYRNDALIAATYLIRNSSFNRNIIAPPIGIANMLEIIVKDGDLFENIKEYVVDKTLENLDEKPQVKS